MGDVVGGRVVLDRRWRVLLAGVAALLVSPGPASAAVLDQSQPTGDGSFWALNTRQQVMQTFVAGRDGLLTRIDLSLWRVHDAAALAPVSVEVEALSGGLPDGTVLGRGELPASAVSTDGQDTWRAVALTTAAPVSAGSAYAITVDSPSPPDIGVLVGYAAGNPYAAGAAGTRDPAGSSGFHAYADLDLAFKTYVEDRAPAGDLADVIAWVRSRDLRPGIEVKLVKSLKAARSALESGDDAGAAKALDRTIAFVERQRGRTIPPAVAERLIDELAALRAAIAPARR